MKTTTETWITCGNSPGVRVNTRCINSSKGASFCCFQGFSGTSLKKVLVSVWLLHLLGSLEFWYPSLTGWLCVYMRNLNFRTAFESCRSWTCAWVEMIVACLTPLVLVFSFDPITAPACKKCTHTHLKTVYWGLQVLTSTYKLNLLCKALQVIIFASPSLQV